MTIVDSDNSKGTITLIVQGVGKSTREMNQLETGDVIRDLVGSLGNPSEIDHYGNVIVIGGGCRVVVNNEVKFACVDGPEFDGHEDYLTTYKTCLPTFWS